MSPKELYDLIDGCRCNNREAQEIVYKHFYHEMYVTCKRYTGHSHDALTILNDGFLKAFTNISKYKKETGNFRPWLKTIIINTAIDYARSIKRETPIINIERAHEQGNNDFQLNFDLHQEEIAEHIKLLPFVTRNVINLFAFDGYNYKEISEQLCISESTTRWHVGEARKRLKQSMQLKQCIHREI